MNFQEWLLTQGVSKATVKHYVGAVYSKLTNFSIELGLSPLRDIQDPDELNEVIGAIKSNPEFIEFNTVGNRMYSAALHKFAKYRYLSSFFSRNFPKKSLSIIQLPGRRPGP